jgi:N-carbamoylputrescine amidase
MTKQPNAASDSVRLGLIQHGCAEAPEVNLATFERLTRQAAEQGAQLIASQELFMGPYFPQAEEERHFDRAEPIPGPTTDRLCVLAAELGVSLTASLFEKRAPGIYHNTSVMIDPKGQITGKYRKMHIPDDPGFYEKYYFTPGDLGWCVKQTPQAKAGMLVCWDQWFPEAARLTAMQGAQILFYPTAIGWVPEDPPDVRAAQTDAWRTVQRSHAITNGVYVAAINRIGTEGGITFWGGSFVADPSGQIIAQASADQEEALIVDCDLSRSELLRRQWPFLRDRRIDAYADLTQRYLDGA